MLGITNGELNPTVVASSKIDSATHKLNTYAPAFHGKLGYDKQFNKNFRLRISGSFYVDKSAANNTLFFGDRTGSHYLFVIENSAATSYGNAWSGTLKVQNITSGFSFEGNNINYILYLIFRIELIQHLDVNNREETLTTTSHKMYIKSKFNS